MTRLAWWVMRSPAGQLLHRIVHRRNQRVCFVCRWLWRQIGRELFATPRPAAGVPPCASSGPRRRTPQPNPAPEGQPSTEVIA